MKPMKIIVSIFLVLVSYTCWGQFTALNKYYDLATKNYTFFLDVIFTDDSLTLLGDVAEDTISKRQNLFLLRMDTLGNIANLKYFFDPKGESENLTDRNAQFAKSSDGGFLFTSVSFERNSNLMLSTLEITHAALQTLGIIPLYSLHLFLVLTSYVKMKQFNLIQQCKTV